MYNVVSVYATNTWIGATLLFHLPTTLYFLSKLGHFFPAASIKMYIFKIRYLVC